MAKWRLDQTQSNGKRRASDASSSEEEGEYIPPPPKPPAGAPPPADVLAKKKAKRSRPKVEPSPSEDCAPPPPQPPSNPPPESAKTSREQKLRVPKPESSTDEDEDDDVYLSCEDELEDGELPRLVDLFFDSEETHEEGDEAKTMKFEKIEPRATSHELMAGGEFDSIESIARVQDDAKETFLNNVNSPEIKDKKRSKTKKRLSVGGDDSYHPELSRLIKARKLALVLDLDHTLLNSVLVPSLRTEANSLQNAMRLLDHDVARAERTGDPLQRSCFHLPHFDLFTKLRPGVRSFLERASKLFEIHISTMGSQAYADQMVALLDPAKKWINGTVKGLGEMENGRLIAPRYKSLDDCGLGELTDVSVIFDDTTDVWAQNLKSLFTCERYLFFPQARRQFGLLGSSLLEVGQDESESEGMLMTAINVFESVHAEYFKRRDALKGKKSPCMQDILEERRKVVISGVHVVFSRVFPLNVKPEEQPLWILAENFGANCSSEITSHTTHVVGTSKATAKVREALKRGGIHAVTPHWLECSMLFWRRANEKNFTIAHH